MIPPLYFSLIHWNYVYFRDYLGKINSIIIFLLYHLSPLFLLKHIFFPDFNATFELFQKWYFNVLCLCVILFLCFFYFLIFFPVFIEK